jgi:hypothetical protein
VGRQGQDDRALPRRRLRALLRERTATSPFSEWETHAADAAALATVAEVSDEGKLVKLRIDDDKSVTVGARLVVIRDRAYAGRVRVTKVDGRTGLAAVEHHEPWLTLAPGDRALNRDP